MDLIGIFRVDVLVDEVVRESISLKYHFRLLKMTEFDPFYQKFCPRMISNKDIDRHF